MEHIKGFKKYSIVEKSWESTGRLADFKTLSRKNIVIGDGISDLELGLVAGTFVYYGGHVWRKTLRWLELCNKEKNLMKILILSIHKTLYDIRIAIQGVLCI